MSIEALLKQHHGVVGVIFECASIFGCGLAAGSALYITLIENEGRAAMTAEQALTNWQYTFPRSAGFFKPFGMVMNAVLAGTIAVTKKATWSVPFVLMCVSGPYTVIYLTPTNDELLGMDPTNVKDQAKSSEIINNTWARGHNLRTVMMSCAFMGTIIATMFDDGE